MFKSPAKSPPGLATEPNALPSGSTGKLAPHWTWVPVPLAFLLIIALWLADLRTPYESRTAMVLLNTVFTWLASLCVCGLAARAFLATGQPGLLMFGAGSLVWGATSLSAATIIDCINPTITTHNLGVFTAAACHVIGLNWKQPLRNRLWFLLAGYTGALLLAGLIFWAAAGGLLPLFFVQGEGGTPIRELVLLAAVAQFGLVAWRMLRRAWRQAESFYYWYGLGLALVASALVGVMLLSVQGGVLGWVNRLTQYLGSTYLFAAAWLAARQGGNACFSLAEIQGAFGGYRRSPEADPQRSWGAFVLHYGAAVLTVFAALELRKSLGGLAGASLPPYITLFPAIMVVALFSGLGPGVAATVVAALCAAYTILPPVGSFYIPAPADRLGLTIFVGTGLLISALAHLYRRTQARADAYAREAALLNSLPAHITVLDRDGTVLHVNARWEQFARENGAGGQPGVSVGANYLETCRQAAQHGDAIAQQALTGIEAVLAGRQPSFQCEYPCHAPDHDRWFLMQVAPVNPVAEGVVVSHLDITAQKRAQEALRESQQRLQLAAVAARLFAFEWDPATDRVRREGDSAGILGVPFNEETGQSFFARLHPEDRAAFVQLVKSLSPASCSYTTTYRVLRPDGAEAYLEESGQALFDADGRFTRLIGMTADITARKRAEAELEKYRHHLEQLVAERTAKLQETVSDLEHFSYAIIHDMRAPLRAMAGFASIMGEDCAGCERGNPALLQRISQAATRMDLLITDSLDYAKTLKREITLEPVDLYSLITDLVLTYPNLQPDKADIELAPGLPKVLGNEAALTQCFSNLLGNAVKFAKPNTTPRIRVYAGPAPAADGKTSGSRADYVRVFVEDEGIGIPDSALPRIFGLFIRATSTHEGTGIGLAIVKKVVERMGGRVGVESTEGQGSRFWVDLRAFGPGE